MTNTNKSATTTTNEVGSISAEDIAKEIGVSGKRFRSFLRSVTDKRAGSGNTYRFDRSTADALIVAYNDKRGRKVTTVSADDLNI